jgi:hypothetical protein
MKGADSLQFDGMDHIYTADDLIIPPYVVVSNAASHYHDYDVDTNGTDTNITETDTDDYLLSGDVRPLQDGDRVSAMATQDGDKIKYIILQKY